MEKEIRTRVITVDYECDTCFKGFVRPSGIVLYSFPAQYEHFCNNCNTRYYLECTYPTQRTIIDAINF